MLAQEDIQAALEALPGAALVGLGVLIVAGLVMWLAGALLIRVACVFSGLAVGGALGWLVGVYFKDEGAYVLPLAIGGAILGGLLAGLLFRLWIAVIGALLLALVVPAVSLVWQGAGPTIDDLDKAELKQTVKESAVESVGKAETLSNAGKAEKAETRAAQMQADADAETDQATLVRVWTKVSDLLVALKDHLAEDARAWWGSLDGAARQIVYLGLLMGAAIGLVLGLVAPWFSAALQSSLIGSWMVYVGTVGLLRRSAGADLAVVPDSARGVILLVGLITALGAFLQWMAYRKQTDKKSHG